MDAATRQVVHLCPQAHVHPQGPVYQDQGLLSRVLLLYCAVDSRGSANLDYVPAVDCGLEEELQSVRLPDGAPGRGCGLGLGLGLQLGRAFERGCEPACALALTLISVLAWGWLQGLVALLKLREGQAQGEKWLAAEEQGPEHEVVPDPVVILMASVKIGEASKVYKAQGCLVLTDTPKIFQSLCESGR